MSLIESWTEETPGVIVRDDGGARTEFRHSPAATSALQEVFGPALLAAYCTEGGEPSGEVVLVFIDTLEATHVPRGRAQSWPVLLRGSVARIAP